MFAKAVDDFKMPFGSSLILMSVITGALVFSNTIFPGDSKNTAAVAQATATSTASTSPMTPSTPERFSIVTSKLNAALTWSAATGTVVNYQITRYEPKSDIEVLFTLSSTTRSMTDTGLHKGWTYTYSLYACNSLGCSYPTALLVTPRK